MSFITKLFTRPAPAAQVDPTASLMASTEDMLNTFYTNR